MVLQKNERVSRHTGHVDDDAVRRLPVLPDIYFSRHQLVFLVLLPAGSTVRVFRLGAHTLQSDKDYKLHRGHLYFALPAVDRDELEGEIERDPRVKYRIRIYRADRFSECARSLKRQEINLQMLCKDEIAAGNDEDRVRNLFALSARREKIAALNELSEQHPLDPSDSDAFIAATHITCRVHLV